MKTLKRNIYKAYIQGVKGTTIEYILNVKRSRMDLLGDRISSIGKVLNKQIQVSLTYMQECKLESSDICIPDYIVILLYSIYLKYLNGVRA